jgi:hypothetical protein|tara:strand:- start:10981 stop:11115 length:135 start_codon:yes stop_codon:yes gene_type:complete
MRDIETRPEKGDLGRKWAWFIGLWLGGVLVVGAVSALLRWILLP